VKTALLAQRIRELREEKGRTQEDLARVLGISRQAYMRLEKGARDITFVEIEKIAAYLEVPYSQITDIDEHQELSLAAHCRNEGCADPVAEAFDRIEDILGVFSAQERLYYRRREGREEVNQYGKA
jgi:transcriptional regulator with XRE-family HTH domain